MYKLTRFIFRAVVPQRIKHWLFWSRSNPLREIALRIKTEIEGRVAHDDVYDAKYYEDHERTMKHAAPFIVGSVLAEFDLETVLDVGCGTGSLLEQFVSRGVSAVGLERSVAALDMCERRNLSVQEFDLESSKDFPYTADLTISTEVAEHLPANFAEEYVRRLACSASLVVMTAATPGQGGTDHANEQPHQYWIEKFERNGMTYNKSLALRWRGTWRADGVDSCYSDNVMVFERRRDSAPQC
jgi:SAM-dependent methyltransferase